MATTYTLIGSPITVGAGGASSVIFSYIPSTYTDLKVVMCARTGRSAYVDDIFVQFNGITTGYSGLMVYGDGSSAISFTSTNAGFATGNTATANTFGNSEMYIPNYTSSNPKSWSSDMSEENNASGSAKGLQAGLWTYSGNPAITQIQLNFNGSTALQYSTFYLYGISNS
jgi:hypothetical protein